MLKPKYHGFGKDLKSKFANPIIIDLTTLGLQFGTPKRKL